MVRRPAPLIRRLPFADWIIADDWAALLRWSYERCRRLDLEPTPVDGSYRCYAPTRGEALLRVTAPRIAATVGEPVHPANSYYRIYCAGDTLRRHTDRDELDYTVSLMLSLTGIHEWPLFADMLGVHQAIPMAVGDAVLLTGRLIPHWRTALTGHCAALLFLHFTAVQPP